MSLDETNRMAQLFEQFKKDLKNNCGNLYYDENDLVDIFDYAGDVADEHIRLEALLLGYKLFPDSADLLKRRAVYLMDTNDQSFGQFLVTNDHMAGSDFLWDIMRCRAFADDKTIVSRLEELITTHRIEEDEEIIQFVKIVHQFGKEDWLLANFDRIADRCAYPDTLKYEIARSAETTDQIEIAIKFMEDLTDLEPFNNDYWCLLADLQVSGKRFAEAATSLEYARAIRPDDPQIYTLEGYIDLQLNKPQEAIKRMERAMELGGDPMQSLPYMMQACAMTGDVAKLRESAQKLFDIDCSNAEAFYQLLATDEHSADNILPRYHASPDSHDEESTIRIVGRLCQEGHAEVALKYLNWYAERYPVSQMTKLAILEMTYLKGEYAEAYQYLDTNFDSLVLTDGELPYVGLIASTLIRVRRFDYARQFVDLWISNLRQTATSNYAITLMVRGLEDSLSEMHALLEANRPLTQDEIERITI